MVTVTSHGRGDEQRLVKLLEFRGEGGKIGRRDAAAGRAHRQRFVSQLATQVFERAVFQMQIIQIDVTVRQPHINVLDVKGIVGDMDIGGQTLERETASLIKREALHTDVEVVVFQLRQSEVGTQIGHRQVVGIKAARLARLVEHVIGKRRLAYHHIIDLYVKRFGRLIVLRLEGIDDELHVGGAVLVGTGHMAVEADDLAIGDDNAPVGYQVLEADAGTQFVDE